MNPSTKVSESNCCTRHLLAFCVHLKCLGVLRYRAKCLTVFCVIKVSASISPTIDWLISGFAGMGTSGLWSVTTSTSRIVVTDKCHCV